MVDTNQKYGIGVFSSHLSAEQALNTLKNSGFAMEKVSILAKDVEQGDRLGNAEMTSQINEQNVNTPTGVIADTLTTSIWGSLLVGLSSLALPGIGPILAAGSLGVALASSVGSVAVGAAATNNVVKALTDFGIPEERARIYSDRILQSNFLVIIEGTDEEINRAESILKDCGIEYWGIYQA